MSTIALHLVTWNGANYLPSLLDSISAQSVQNFTVRIHDNNSDDQSFAIITKWAEDKGLDISQSPTNLGFAGAHNLLFSKCSEDYILLVNQDMVLSVDYVKKLGEALDNNTNYGAVSGVLYRDQNHTIDSAGLQIERHHAVKEITTLPETEVKKVFGVSGAAPMYRKIAIDDVSYLVDGKQLIFSDKFHSYKEDVDLSYRLQLAGWQSAVLRSATAIHFRSMKKDGLNKRKSQGSISQYYSYRNHLLFLRHTANFKWFSFTGITVFFYEAVKLIWILLKETKSLKAWLDIWKLRSDTKQKRLQNSLHCKNPQAVTLWYGKN